ncbi:MAG: hypothetical protein AAF658_04305, partial [Myxococcota bacterium]
MKIPVPDPTRAHEARRASPSGASSVLAAVRKATAADAEAIAGLQAQYLVTSRFDMARGGEWLVQEMSTTEVVERMRLNHD